MTREEARQKATLLVEKMTVEEAAGQLRYDAPAIERLGIPAYNWWNEALHGVARAGVATCFPQAIGMGATFDKALIRQVAEAIALEARAKYNAYSAQGDRSQYKGVTMWAPNINIFRDPRWGRGQETFGEDPVLTASLGVEMVEGLQTKVDGFMTTAACAKHLAVHSGPEALRHQFDAKVNKKDLYETYLPAFKACVTEAGVEAVMGAYNRTNGEACCAHSYLMEEVLRGDWDFKGHFVSDCWAIRDFHEYHGITKKPEDSAAYALKHGCDLNCGCSYQYLMDAYHHGKITKQEIFDSAIRLFTARYMLGLFDKSALDDIPYEVVGCKAHRALAYKTAVNSCVLLSNKGTLPLQPAKYKRIAVMGPNADSADALIGNYFGTPPKTTTLLEGIWEKCENHDIQLLYAEGSHLYIQDNQPKPHRNYRSIEAAVAAKNADLVILCVGLDATIEGEQGDRGNEFASGDKVDLLLPKAQRHLIQKVMDTQTPFILVNASGSAIDLSAYEEKAEAILQVWYPGGEGGRAVADILFGDAAPGGKLPVTFYYNHNNIPDITDYAMSERTYRYMQEKPWKRFGYGLTYGQVRLCEAKLCRPGAAYEAAAEAGVDVEVRCENTSDRALREVLQVYVHVEGSKNEVTNHKLAAFEAVDLTPGEAKNVVLHIPAQRFWTINEEGRACADGDGATIYIGFCQPSREEARNAVKIII